jgi:hypothetical protein
MLRLLALVLPGLVTAAVVNRTKSYLDDVDVHNFEANHSSHGRRLIEVFVQDTLHATNCLIKEAAN